MVEKKLYILCIILMYATNDCVILANCCYAVPFTVCVCVMCSCTHPLNISHARLLVSLSAAPQCLSQCILFLSWKCFVLMKLMCVFVCVCFMSVCRYTYSLNISHARFCESRWVPLHGLFHGVYIFVIKNIRNGTLAISFFSTSEKK